MSCSYDLLIFTEVKVLILNCSYYSLFSLQFLDFPEDQTRPDQTGLNRIRLDLCHIRTHTAFFKVKCINLVFTNYILVYLQVSVFRGDSKSFFVSYMKPYRANHKAGSLLRDFP